MDAAEAADTMEAELVERCRRLGVEYKLVVVACRWMQLRQLTRLTVR